MRGEGDVNLTDAQERESQFGGLSSDTLGRAMRFAKAYLAARGMDSQIELHPRAVIAAYEVVQTIEDASDENELAAVMAQIAARLREVDDGDQRGAIA